MKRSPSSSIYRLMKFHAIICGFQADFHVSAHPSFWSATVELHGKIRPKFERDRERDSTVTAAGYIVVRFTWRRLVKDPKWVANKVLANPARWGHLDPGVSVPESGLDAQIGGWE